MVRHVLLNNIEHGDLLVDTGYTSQYGDNINAVLTFPTEYADIQREYPIFFRKDAVSGEFQSVAITGFEKGENLFLNEPEWSANYVPALHVRGPFLIGFQEQVIDGHLLKEPVIHIDLDNPRVNTSHGERAFLPHGGNSPYLENIALVLKGIHQGMQVSRDMFAAYIACDLIEPVNIEITFHNDSIYQLDGYYTISQERLARLSGEQLEKLNRAGFLQGAFLALASMTNLKKLINMKNERNRAAV